MSHPPPLGSYRYTRLTPAGWVADQPMPTSAELTLQAASRYGITHREIPGTRIIELEYQGHKTYFQAQNPFGQSTVALYATQNKSVEKNLLQAAGVTTARGFAILKSDHRHYWAEVFHALKQPLVIKPTHGTQGQHVYTGVRELAELEQIVARILPLHPSVYAGVIVEEMFAGEEYRILATPDEVIGITNRKPANVVGDGHHSIAELIAIKNQDPRRQPDPNNYLVTIQVDEHVQRHLAHQGFNLASVPAAGQHVRLRLNSNISTGGDSIDVTDLAHPSIKQIARQAVRAIPGLLFAGIDLMTHDITAPQTSDSYIVVEVNDSPGYSIHDLPYQGQNRHAAEHFLRLLFPQLELTPVRPA